MKHSFQKKYYCGISFNKVDEYKKIVLVKKYIFVEYISNNVHTIAYKRIRYRNKEIFQINNKLNISKSSCTISVEIDNLVIKMLN